MSATDKDQTFYPTYTIASSNVSSFAHSISHCAFACVFVAVCVAVMIHNHQGKNDLSCNMCFVM